MAFEVQHVEPLPLDLDAAGRPAELLEAAELEHPDRTGISGMLCTRSAFGAARIEPPNCWLPGSFLKNSTGSLTR